jgi:hypothetical protein
MLHQIVAGEFGEDLTSLVGRSHSFEPVGSLPGGEYQVFVIGKDEAATCLRCGKAVEMPPAEVLDVDRTPYGRWRQSLDL